ALLMLIAFLLYNDGIQTMIRMASVYGAEVGIDSNAQIAAFVLVQFVGVPFSFLFGMLAGRIGAKPAIFISVVVYTIVSIIGYFLSNAFQFFVLAFLVGTVQGGSQALSRSLFARMIPRHKSSEYFGFFSVFEKFAGVAGPALFAASVMLFGSSRAVGHPVLRRRRGGAHARQRRGGRSAGTTAGIRHRRRLQRALCGGVLFGV